MIIQLQISQATGKLRLYITQERGSSWKELFEGLKANETMRHIVLHSNFAPNREKGTNMGVSQIRFGEWL